MLIKYNIGLQCYIIMSVICYLVVSIDTSIQAYNNFLLDNHNNNSLNLKIVLRAPSFNILIARAIKEM